MDASRQYDISDDRISDHANSFHRRDGQESRWKIKLENVKPSGLTKVKDFTRAWSCCGFPREEHGLDRARSMIEEFNEKNIEERFNRIPKELKGAYRSRIDAWFEGLKDAYRQTLRGYRADCDSDERRVGLENMGKILKEFENVEKELKMLQKFQEARKICEEKLDCIPAELKEVFKSDIDKLVEEVKKVYDISFSDYKYNYSSYEIRLDDKNMENYLNNLNNLNKMEKELKMLQEFQEARKLFEDVLNYICQDCQPLVKEKASQEVIIVIEAYKDALQGNSDPKYARRDIKKAYKWLNEKHWRLEGFFMKKLGLQISNIKHIIDKYGKESEKLEFKEACKKYKKACKKYERGSKETLSTLDQWRKEFGQIHDNVIENLSISREDKEKLKDFQKFIFFHDSINEILDKEVVHDDKDNNRLNELLSNENLYAAKIDKLANGYIDGHLKYVNSWLPYWNKDDSIKQRSAKADAAHEKFKNSLKNAWQLLHRRPTVVSQSLDSSAQN